MVAGCCALASGALALGKPSGSSNPNYEAQERKTKERDAYKWRSNVKDYPPREAYEHGCTGSDKRDDCLLLWRSTRAAEIQAKAAVDQVYWSHAAFWFLVFTFVATSLAAYFAYRAAEATHAGAVADEASAKTADETLKTMQRTARSELRVWTTYTSVNIDEIDGYLAKGVNYPRALELSIRWTNSGRSPALNVAIASDSQILGYNDTKVPIFATVPKTRGPAVIGPGITMSGESIALYGDSFDNFVGRRTKVFLYSVVQYRDAYNPEELWKSECCIQIKYRGMGKGRDGKPRIALTMGPMGPQNTAT